MAGRLHTKQALPHHAVAVREEARDEVQGRDTVSYLEALPWRCPYPTGQPRRDNCA